MTSLIYKKRTNWGEHWTVYTNKDTVYFMLDQLDYKSENNLSSISILDPCSGDWVFIICCLERLLKSSRKYNFSFEKALEENFLAIEIDEIKVQRLEENIKDFLNRNSISITNLQKIIWSGDFLLKWIQRKFDIVIGNPPYIRYDNIPDVMKWEYRVNFKTFKWRCDIYVPFYEKGLNLLNENWRLCYICSNRWLKNDYWTTLRKLISSKYDFDKIINLEHIKVFDENVIAYPAITIIKNRPSNNQTEYYDILDKDVLTTWLSNASNSKFRFTLLDDLVDGNWNFWQIKHPTFKLIEGQWFEMWIWAATGADKIFISKTLEESIESDLLIPIIFSRDLRGNNLSWSWNYLINPFTEDGELINLIKYPKLNSYFEYHKSTLLSRHISKKNPNKWYRTIDRIKPSLLGKKKLLIPDTSWNEIIMMDQWTYYPHHNLAYITHKNEKDLKILWALLSSEFWRNQMRKAWNLMNWGFIRWQIQNLRKILLPNIMEIPTFYKEKIIDAYDSQDMWEINNSILSLFKQLEI